MALLSPGFLVAGLLNLQPPRIFSSSLVVSLFSRFLVGVERVLGEEVQSPKIHLYRRGRFSVKLVNALLHLESLPASFRDTLRFSAQNLLLPSGRDNSWLLLGLIPVGMLECQ